METIVLSVYITLTLALWLCGFVVVVTGVLFRDKDYCGNLLLGTTLLIFGSGLGALGIGWIVLGRILISAGLLVVVSFVGVGIYYWFKSNKPGVK